MKKIIAILLIAIISLGAAGCKNDTDYTYEYNYESTVSTDEEDISSYAPPKLEGSEEYDLVDFDEFVAKYDSFMEGEVATGSFELMKDTIYEGELVMTEVYPVEKRYRYGVEVGDNGRETESIEILTNSNNEVLYVSKKVPKEWLFYTDEERSNQEKLDAVSYLVTFFLSESAVIYTAMGGASSVDDAYQLIRELWEETTDGQVDSKYFGDYEYGFAENDGYMVFLMRSPFTNQ